MPLLKVKIDEQIQFGRHSQNIHKKISDKKLIITRRFGSDFPIMLLKLNVFKPLIFFHSYMKASKNSVYF